MISSKVFPAINMLDNQTKLSIFRTGITGQFPWRKIVKLLDDNTRSNALILMKSLEASAITNSFIQSVNETSISFASHFSGNSTDEKIYQKYMKMAISDRVVNAANIQNSVKSDVYKNLVTDQLDKDINFILNSSLFVHSYLRKIYDVEYSSTETQKEIIRCIFDNDYKIDEPFIKIKKEFNNCATHLITCMKEDEQEFFKTIMNKVITEELILVNCNKTVRLLEALKDNINQSVYNATKRKLKFWEAEPADGIKLLRENLNDLPKIKALMVDTLFKMDDKKVDAKEETNAQKIEKIKVIAKAVNRLIQNKASHDTWKRYPIVRDLYNQTSKKIIDVSLLEPGIFDMKKSECKK